VSVSDDLINKYALFFYRTSVDENVGCREELVKQERITLLDEEIQTSGRKDYGNRADVLWKGQTSRSFVSFFAVLEGIQGPLSND
jgi:hypothetical protein